MCYRVPLTFLTRLLIWSAESLESIARFTCGSLQLVNVYGCRLLRPAGFSTILDSTVSLRELRCGGCDRLDRLEIPQATLVRLEAQGCTSLRRYVLSFYGTFISKFASKAPFQLFRVIYRLFFRRRRKCRIQKLRLILVYFWSIFVKFDLSLTYDLSSVWFLQVLLWHCFVSILSAFGSWSKMTFSFQHFLQVECAISNAKIGRCLWLQESCWSLLVFSRPASHAVL